MIAIVPTTTDDSLRAKGSSTGVRSRTDPYECFVPKQ
jgi:hypothetical protein